MQHLTSVHLEEMEQTTGNPDKSGFLYQEDLGQAERSAKKSIKYMIVWKIKIVTGNLNY